MSQNHIYSYGTTSDYLTGESLNDTDDERIRQEMARIFVEERGYSKHELLPRKTITTSFSAQTVVSSLDLIISLNNYPLMVCRSAPGSLVSRERAAIAAARVFHPRYQLPLALIYNGRDAELLDTGTGRILANGLQSFLYSYVSVCI